MPVNALDLVIGSPALQSTWIFVPTVSDHRKEQIRLEAHAKGFVGCGFSGAARLPDEPRLRDWLQRGRHGDMSYLARDLDRRVEPTLFLEGARTVIVVAWPYAAPARPSDEDWRVNLTGRIAAYARGIDYHDALATKVEELAVLVSQLYGGSARAHVDAGPLVEKSLARRAGLGWFGRNTNILLPDRGSYVLLACLLTTASIEPDDEYTSDHCGACSSCIPACPTGAIGEDATIDAPRCLSYLTIEHRGPISHSLRPQLGNWIFGCDDCQTSCPWNDPDEHADNWLNPSLAGVLSISPEEFRETYRHTAVSRTKRRGLARNAAIALGNSGNEAATDPLSRAVLEHDEALVRAHAAWALGALGGSSVGDVLRRSLELERVPPVRTEIEQALHLLRDRPA